MKRLAILATLIFSRPALADGFMCSMPTGMHLDSSAPAGDGTRLMTVSRKAVDLRGGPAAVGIYLGNDGSAQEPVWVDPGTVTLEGLGGWSRFMPTVISSPYVYFDGTTVHQSDGPFAAVVIPHSGIGSSGPLCLPWVATIYTDGAPDVNPDLTVDTTLPGEGTYAIYVGGDAVRFGGSVVWGQPENGGSNYEDCASGVSAPVAGVGHVRRACDTTPGKMGFNVNVDGDPHWQPLPVAMQFLGNWGTGYGQPTTSFAPGETTLKTWRPNDARGAGDHGLRSWEPHRWNLPAQQTISGGVVKACMRFVVASGSSQLLCNATGSAAAIARDSVFLALAGTWITEARAVVVNTSGSASPPLDIGLIQFEGTAF